MEMMTSSMGPCEDSQGTGEEEEGMAEANASETGAEGEVADTSETGAVMWP